MDIECTLEMLNNKEAIYRDNFYHSGDSAVKARIGGDDLMLRTVERLDYWVEKYSDHCYREELEILGHYLYNIAFCTPDKTPRSTDDPLPLKTAFEKTYQRFKEMREEEERKNESKSRLRLMLVFRKQAETLSTFPWEFIFMPKEKTFLAGEETDLILTRFVPDKDPAHVLQRDLKSEKLRILIVLSKPKELDIVDADDLISDLIERLSELPQQIDVGRLDQPTRRTLSEKIEDFEPHIVHFVGHGKEGVLALIKEEQDILEAEAANEVRKLEGEKALPIEYADWLDSRSVSNLFRRHIPRLVFLHACKSAASEFPTRSLRRFTNMARELAYTKIPAVIAMQYEISNEDAKRFAKIFYRQIRQGKHIDEAVVEARRELANFTSGRQAWDDRNFGTPVIYLQSEQPIIQPPPLEDRGTETSVKRVPCPYPDCRGEVIPSKKFCVTCKRPLMPCPECQEVMAQRIGFCDNCGYDVEKGAQSAQAVTPRANITAAPTAPADAMSDVGQTRSA